MYRWGSPEVSNFIRIHDVIVINHRCTGDYKARWPSALDSVYVRTVSVDGRAAGSIFRLQRSDESVVNLANLK